ncbi:hypothetical protein TeGR_g645, partial [Tetraparma gracilis]
MRLLLPPLLLPCVLLLAAPCVSFLPAPPPPACSPLGELRSLSPPQAPEKDPEVQAAAAALLDDLCAVDVTTPTMMPVDPDPECVDEGLYNRAVSRFSSAIGSTMSYFRADSPSDADIEKTVGELLEQGWESRGSSSALRRNAEVWKFALKCVFKVLAPRKLAKRGAPEAEVLAAKTAAALFIRDGLLTLGPTFVKLGQVVSTRTDVLGPEYIAVLKTLQDDVPAFGGARARRIIEEELGVNSIEDKFVDFDPVPIAAASLGQVHTAYYKGKK